MHQALYRKYRPKTFDDVCGQDHITKVLKYEIDHSEISHAYLFCGSRGTGKTSSAKILACAINCESPINGSPCGKCNSCKYIESGADTDILEMDAASNNKVDDIRAILDEVVYTPSSLKYRVYIVDEVHMLSTSAFNALLKTLEEPPSHVVFILATTEMQKLPATIVSRCQRFDFRRIPVPVLTSRLEYIASRENIRLEHDAALMLARLAQGGMRDAVSLLELCAGGNDIITPETVNDSVGSAGREAVSCTVRSIAKGNSAELFDIVAQTDSSAKDVGVFWGELISYYRDMLVVKIGADAVKYLDLTENEMQMLSADAALFTREALLYHSKMLDDAFISMQKAGAIRRSIAELTLLRMSDIQLDTRPEAILARVSALETAVKSGLINNIAPIIETASDNGAVATEDKSTDSMNDDSVVNDNNEKAGTVVAPKKNADKPVRKQIRSFAEICEKVSETDKSLAGFLKKCRAYNDNDDGIVLYCESAISKNLLSREKSRSIIAVSATAVLGKRISSENIKVEVVSVAEEPNDAILLDEELQVISNDNI